MRPAPGRLLTGAPGPAPAALASPPRLTEPTGRAQGGAGGDRAVAAAAAVPSASAAAAAAADAGPAPALVTVHVLANEGAHVPEIEFDVRADLTLDRVRASVAVRLNLCLKHRDPAAGDVQPVLVTEVPAPAPGGGAERGGSC